MLSENEREESSRQNEQGVEGVQRVQLGLSFRRMAGSSARRCTESRDIKLTADSETVREPPWPHASGSEQEEETRANGIWARDLRDGPPKIN